MINEPRIACVDVDYRGTGATAGGLWFHGWGAEATECQAVASIPEVTPYEPGAFYKRELPCLLKVLALGPPAAVVVVDGYVWLADSAKGLGAHLHDVVGGVVIGVAKTRYAGGHRRGRGLPRGEPVAAVRVGGRDAGR